MTEQMRRELEIAVTVAKAQGLDYGAATPEQKASCHKIARIVLPGVNRLVDNAEINARQVMEEQVVDTYTTASRKAYDEGFDDGQKNDYNNRWQESKEHVTDLERLMGWPTSPAPGGGPGGSRPRRASRPAGGGRRPCPGSRGRSTGSGATSSPSPRRHRSPTRSRRSLPGPGKEHCPPRRSHWSRRPRRPATARSHHSTTRSGSPIASSRSRTPTCA